MTMGTDARRAEFKRQNEKLKKPAAEPVRSLLASIPSFLTVSQAAGSLQLSPDTIYRAVAAGELRACRIGRCIRIAADDIAAFVSARQTAAVHTEVPAADLHRLARGLRALDADAVQRSVDAAINAASSGWGRRGKRGA